MTERPGSSLIPFPDEDDRTTSTDALILWMTRLSRRRAWHLTILSIAAITAVDYASGPDFWFGPIYLLAICLPAWVLGQRAALAAGILTSFISYSLNNWSSVPHGELAMIWNLSMRLVAILTVILLVGGFRRSFDREWRRARLDPLTGALTRQAFDERTLRAAHPRESWALLAYIDLDGFKRINDRHGHAAGDAVLRSFAATALAHLPVTASFARIGGDEFLLFLPVAGRDTGLRMARLWHERLNDIRTADALATGCSMGAVVLDAATMTADDIELADRLMYTAKRASGPTLRVADQDALSAAIRPPARPTGWRPRLPTADRTDAQSAA